MFKLNKSIDIILILITIIYGIYRLIIDQNVDMLGSFGLVTIISYLFTKDITNSLLMAIIFNIIWELTHMYRKNTLENFDDKKKDDDKTNHEEEEENNTHSEEEGEEDKENFYNNNDADEDDVSEPYLDVGRSFLEAYKNLSPKQIEGLTFDTKELLTTQQKLIETLNAIGPTLKEGKNMMDSFKNYFVDDVPKL